MKYQLVGLFGKWTICREWARPNQPKDYEWYSNLPNKWYRFHWKLELTESCFFPDKATAEKKLKELEDGK